MPAALAEPGSARALAGRLAGLVGTGGAVLATSTLHAFWDLFVVPSGPARLTCYIDAGAYPIAGWGAERAAAHGMLVKRFPHHCANALARLLEIAAGWPPAPWWSPMGCARAAGGPRHSGGYLGALRPLGGLLVVDDTQAVGIFGRDAAPRQPYGHGGGGSLRMAGLSSPDVLVVSSLAKALGVPVA